MISNEVCVHIKTKTGEHEQETSFNMSDVNELQKTIIIQNIFAVMGVENDISKMIDDYAKIGRAYHNFFQKVEPIESTSTEELSIHNGQDYQQKEYSKKILAKEYEKALEPSIIKAEEFDNELSKIIPEHYQTGIKKDSILGDKYQCRLVCLCGKATTRYIGTYDRRVTCPDCGRKHKVRYAKRMYLEKDSNNNFFIAGKFKGEDENT